MLSIQIVFLYLYCINSVTLVLLEKNIRDCIIIFFIYKGRRVFAALARFFILSLINWSGGYTGTLLYFLSCIFIHIVCDVLNFRTNFQAQYMKYEIHLNVDGRKDKD